MVGRTDAATIPEKARFAQLQELGCVVCWVYCKVWRAADISHLLDGGVRVGHEATIPECEWHHRGVLPSGYSEYAARRVLGASRAHGSKPYAEAFGTDAELLEMTNQLVTRLSYAKGRSRLPLTQPVRAIVASEWTIAGEHAVHTRMLSVAQRVGQQAGDGANGEVGGVRWMRLEDFQEACAHG